MATIVSVTVLLLVEMGDSSGHVTVVVVVLQRLCVGSAVSWCLAPLSPHDIPRRVVLYARAIFPSLHTTNHLERSSAPNLYGHGIDSSSGSAVTGESDMSPLVAPPSLLTIADTMMAATTFLPSVAPTSYIATYHHGGHRCFAISSSTYRHHPCHTTHLLPTLKERQPFLPGQVSNLKDDLRLSALSSRLECCFFPCVRFCLTFRFSHAGFVFLLPPLPLSSPPSFFLLVFFPLLLQLSKVGLPLCSECRAYTFLWCSVACFVILA